MRIALVNLPHPTPVIRRYMCSYNSPIFLFPPLELMYAASALRAWDGHEVIVIDAIARRWTREDVLAELKRFDAQVVLTLLGFEIFEPDVNSLKWLRSQLPAAKFAVFGHYPSTFPAETMQLTGVDYVIHGEPEVTLAEICRALEGQKPWEEIGGLSYRNGQPTPLHNPTRPWLKEVNQLPHPDYGMVNIHDYSEFMMPSPFAVLQTARGCPYPCNFCVRSYGQRMGMRTPDNILEELQQLVDRFQIRSFRFIDDTFTAIPERTVDICNGLREHFPQLVWTCLSRVDTLDGRRAKFLAESGCRRVYLGIESGSERILKLYGKDYGLDKLPESVRLLRKHGIEVGAFFMVGHPEETEEDFQETRRAARSLELDYSGINFTSLYPGTPLYEQYKDQVEFSLYPYRNEWKNPGRRAELHRWGALLYRDLYFNAPYLVRHAFRLMKHPRTAVAAARALVPHMLGGRSDAAVIRDELI